ncbi:MAG: HK97 family phage prohead protease [Alphaproteobacteria bacterium]
MQSKTNHSFKIKSLSEQGVFAGYASAYTLDAHHEVVERGAFQKNLTLMEAGQGMPKMLWQHDPMQPIGRWEKIVENDQGLYVEGRLFLELPKAQEAYILVKEGVVDGLSIGFEVVRSKKMPNHRLLQEIKLHEISLVTFPANTQARVQTVKQISDIDCLIRQIDKLKGAMA